MQEFLKLASIVLLASIFGYMGWLAREQFAVQECRQLHNVYACELAASPSEPAE